MCIEIFEQDAYVFEFEASVTSVEGDWVSLDATAFYPGGGGQVHDLGKICGLDVKEVRRKGGDIIHSVPKHSLKAGDKIWCSVDWERRYDLMKGHTAEHLLFGSLKREVPELNIVKIFISPDSKYVIVDTDVPWDSIKKAQESVNSAIRDNLPVTKSTVSKDDPDIGEIRAKLERIEGDVMTVVEIGDVDVAACSGIHVRETEEIVALLVDRKVSAGKDGVAIHFRIGDDAISRSMELSNICLQMIETLGTKPEDAVKAAQNIRHEAGTKASQLRTAVSRLIADLRPETMNGIPVYSGIFDTDDRNTMTDAAEKIKNGGGVAVLFAKSETISVFLSSGTKGIDCSKVLKDAVSKTNGRGGGKADFAQGGVPDVTVAETLMNDILTAVKNSIAQK
ncbi:MAG: DHHA1 domain-containing protein [Methanomassiliicoccaceae archaeon]|nr:DHHA1 domain-containing protein [Methanomassiliicoccaceae archaeon]